MALLMVAALVLGAACTNPGSAPADAAAPGRDFHGPQGVAASARWILVANTAIGFEGGRAVWGRGFVSFVDRETRRVVARVPTTQKNPQDVVVVGQRAYVVNGGTTRLGTGGDPVSVTAGGGIDVFDLSGDAPPSAPQANIPLGVSSGDKRIGGYGSIAVSADGRVAFVGSGTRGDVFKVDLAQRRVLRGPDNPISMFDTPAGLNGLTTVRRFGDRFVVLDYNSDQLCVSADVAGDLARRDCRDVGVNDALIEGPIDVADDGAGNALVLMTIANAVYRVADPLARGAIDARFARTGLSNNRVVVDGGQAYVVNSMSHTLQRTALSGDRTEPRFVVFPVRSNPFDMVVTREGQRRLGWVTLFEGHGLAVVDLDSGELLEVVGSSAGGGGDGGAGADSAAGGGDGGVQDVGGAGGDAGAGGDDGGAGGDGAGAIDAAPCDSGGDGGAVVGIANVVSVRYGSGAGHGQSTMPDVIAGAPDGAKAGGAVAGVLSLGASGEIIVDFGAYDIVDGPGPDFIVYENPFLVGPYQPYAEPGIVAVSATSSAASAFVSFPCDLSKTAGDPSSKTWPYPGCAGVRPVIAGGGRCVDPRNAVAAGGDAFDLADIKVNRARYLRITDANLGPVGAQTRGFDLDAVVLINYVKR